MKFDAWWISYRGFDDQSGKEAFRECWEQATREMLKASAQECGAGAGCCHQAAVIERLEAENGRLSALADKWNSECDEMREDNKRLDAECAKLRKLLEDCLYALEYADDMTKPEGLSGCDCPICTTTIALHKELRKKP